MNALWRQRLESFPSFNILGPLIQPQLQSFVFRGLGIEVSDVADGARQAVSTIFSHRNDTPDAPRLTEMVEPRLCSRMAAADCAEWPRPELLRIEKAAVDHIRLIIGGQRKNASRGQRMKSLARKESGITPTSIGRDLIILSRDNDFRGIPKFFRKIALLDYSEEYLRSLMTKSGMTIQVAVDLNCVLAGPPSIRTTIENEAEKGSDVHDQETQQICQRWLFESPMDANFKEDLDWQVVDVNGVMGGAEFWRN